MRESAICPRFFTTVSRAREPRPPRPDPRRTWGRGVPGWRPAGRAGRASIVSPFRQGRAHPGSGAPFPFALGRDGVVSVWPTGPVGRPVTSTSVGDRQCGGRQRWRTGRPGLRRCLARRRWPRALRTGCPGPQDAPHGPVTPSAQVPGALDAGARHPEGEAPTDPGTGPRGRLPDVNPVPPGSPWKNRRLRSILGSFRTGGAEPVPCRAHTRIRARP